MINRFKKSSSFENNKQVPNTYLATQSDFTVKERESIFFVKEYTMTSAERLVALSRSLEYIVENEIEGDIVECGVWRGGSMMLAANKLCELNSNNRILYLFDTFEGMTEPDENDIAWDSIAARKKLAEAEKFAGRNVWCYSSLEEVQKNMSKTNYPKDKIVYIKGNVEDTLPHECITKIALLRLDTDWYKSTKHELECLYDKVVAGGILIIDDYGHWRGAQKAVDEFIKARGLKVFLNRIDSTGRLVLKID